MIDFSSNVATINLSAGVLTLSANSPPVNALGRDVRQAVADAVALANNTPDVKALIISCAGRTFFAGADIKEFGKPPQPPSLPDIVDRIENARVTVVAAIHGTALGGGLEIALGCHFRVAALSARLGLPEVKLGLLPGAGGTQRLPRLVGIATALDMMTEGNPKRPRGHATRSGPAIAMINTRWRAQIQIFLSVICVPMKKSFAIEMLRRPS
jgi:3-hydroxyacyl-CoA dehydrogenase